MSIPTHNLYDFVHQVTERRFNLMYFHPWGEKNLSNLIFRDIEFDDCSSTVAEQLFPDTTINSIHARSLQPVLVCHDQEPLFFDLYNDDSELVKSTIDKNILYRANFFSNLNLRHSFSHSRQKFWVLLHSEINSIELEKYEATGLFRGAYWWSHAIIARDWYRFAKYDIRLKHKNIEKLFLMYCRDTSGIRSYRKTVQQHLSNKKLHNHIHYGTPGTTADASAHYNHRDFNSTGISIVLETVFEDQRIHFTEKILRAIACGHPFILAGGPGSLTVLKQYGFKTFSPLINEQYDLISNPENRIDAIVTEIERISQLPNVLDIIEQCQKIANYNQQHFFSDVFFNTVVKELQTNVNSIGFENFGLDHHIIEKIIEIRRSQGIELSGPPLEGIIEKLKNNIKIS